MKRVTPPTGQPPSKQVFGRNLDRLMRGKGLTQAELTRLAGFPNRNIISTYISGRSYPNGANLKKLAAALGVTPDELLPNRAGLIRGEPLPDLSIRVMPNDPNRAWLIVNRLVPTLLAAKIIQMIAEEPER